MHILASERQGQTFGLDPCRWRSLSSLQCFSYSAPEERSRLSAGVTTKRSTPTEQSTTHPWGAHRERAELDSCSCRPTTMARRQLDAITDWMAKLMRRRRAATRLMRPFDAPEWTQVANTVFRAVDTKRRHRTRSW